MSTPLIPEVNISEFCYARFFSSTGIKLIFLKIAPRRRTGHQS